MLSNRSIETLLDLAENKLSAIVPFDRDDMREIRTLELCIEELRALKTGGRDGQAKGRPRAPKREPQRLSA